jgi:hypothetical protein
MSKSTLGLVIGGLLPALLFGLSGVCQKSSARAGISVGPYLLIIGCIVVLAGTLVTVFQQEAAVNWRSAGYTTCYGVLWSSGVACIAVALRYFDVQISQLVPLYNMNTLVAVVLGLVLFAEWRDLHAGKLLLGAILIVAGGVLAATSAR